MKKTMRAVVVMGVMLVALPAAAAIEYEFFQKSTSDADNIPPSDLTARVTIDGSRTRVDVVGGNVYPPGTYIVSVDNSRTLRFVDPINKSYTEFNTASAASAIGAGNIKIENIKSEVTKLADRPMVAGQPTDHYRLVMSYDITVSFGKMPLTQSVRTVIDRWTTVAFGDIGTSTNSAAFQTGNVEADQIIGLETTKITGFPLREVVSITTTSLKQKTAGSSTLKMSPTRSRTREMVVTKIHEARADAMAFVIPAAYRKTDVQEDAKPQIHTLTLEPTSK
jgi:hypothetical protein